MLRLFVFALTVTASLATCFLDPCIAQTPTPAPAATPVNPPYDNSGRATMWTYRNGTDSASRAFAFRIEGTSGQNHKAKLSMYTVKDIDSGKFFEKQKIKVLGTNIDAYTIDCKLEPDAKKGYLIKVQTSPGVLENIGVLSTTPGRQFALIRWQDNKLQVDGKTINNPCDEPPEIGEEELVAIGVDSSTPGPTLTITATPKVTAPAVSSAIEPN